VKSVAFGLRISAEEPKVSRPGPVTRISIAAHVTVHGLPFPTSTEGGRRSRADGFKHREQGRFNLDRALVKESVGRDTAVGGLVVGDPVAKITIAPDAS
jgi:hypothetical protein